MDSDPAGDVSDYIATVNTGDATLDSVNNPSNVTIVANMDGGFDVQLSYTYAEELRSGRASCRERESGGADSVGASMDIKFNVAEAALTSGDLAQHSTSDA